MTNWTRDSQLYQQLGTKHDDGMLALRQTSGLLVSPTCSSKCANNSCCNTSQSDTDVTKKSRLTRTPTGTHGLRKTSGSRGGPLAGALHSMPAEASSAVVGEHKEKNPVRCGARVAQRSSRAWLQRLTHNSLVTRRVQQRCSSVWMQRLKTPAGDTKVPKSLH